jgi:hypothetical protein
MTLQVEKQALCRSAAGSDPFNTSIVLCNSSKRMQRAVHLQKSVVKSMQLAAVLLLHQFCPCLLQAHQSAAGTHSLCRWPHAWWCEHT